MAKGFDTLHVRSAVRGRNKFDLSRTHLTTMNFGEIVPLMCEETVPGDDIKVKANYFSRMAPLVKPTYGKFQFKTMTAFVPYHQIAEDFEGWIAGKTVYEGENVKFRSFDMETLVAFLLYGCNGTLVTTVSTTAEIQLSIIDASGNAVNRKFTDKGRYVVKVLNALGYAIPQGVDLQTGSNWMGAEGAYKLSAYPLLAFFKAYNDYMSQSQRFNISALSAFLRAVKQNKTVTGYNAATGQINYQGISILFDNLFLCYDNDYFTSAWRYPVSPLGTNTQAQIAMSGVPVDPSYQVENDDVDVIIKSVATDGSMYELGQRALDWLKSFDAWVRRNNYSGSRAVQQIYSRFGIKTDDFRTHYAHVLGTDVMPIQVGDVTSTSDATGADLGDYAGKGIVSGGNGVECKADDYGLLVVFGWFTVSPMNSFGFDRKVLRNQPLDYYNPEFDGIGADAISAGEYYADPTVDPSTDSTSDMQVYGYTERYNSYRYGRDQITGEFRDYLNNSGQNVWHTGRYLTTVRQSGNLVAQAPAVINHPQTSSEYNRIFSITNGSVDTFYVTAQFSVDAIRPMLNHNQVPQLGEGDTVVPRNGNTIN